MSIRRSRRGNKGINPKLELEEEKTKEIEVFEEVRCLVCGTYDLNYDEEEDKGGPMIQCEKCLTWQHIKCMFGHKNTSKVPKKYFCEICNPNEFSNIKHKLLPHVYFTEITSDSISSRISNISKYLDNVNDDNNYMSSSGSESENFVDNENQPPEIKKRRIISKQKPKANEIKQHNEEACLKVRNFVTNQFLKVFKENLTPQMTDTQTISNGDEWAANLEEIIFSKLNDITNEKDPGLKYKEKYRNLFFALRDPKNTELRNRIINGSLSPEHLIDLKIEELINPDLQKFRIESIKQKIAETTLKPIDIKPTDKSDESNLSEKENKALVNEPSILLFDFPAKSVNDHDNFFEDSLTPINHDYELNTRSRIDYVESEKEDKPLENSQGMIFWKGFTKFSGISNYYTELKLCGSEETINDLSDVCYTLLDLELPLELEGRLDSKRGEKYLTEIMATRDLIVGEFSFPDSSDNLKLKNLDAVKYFEERKRYGVLKNLSKSFVKDIYLIPANDKESIPEFLKSILYKTFTLEIPKLLIVFTVKKHYKPKPRSVQDRKSKLPKINEDNAPTKPNSDSSKTRSRSKSSGRYQENHNKEQEASYSIPKTISNTENIQQIMLPERINNNDNDNVRNTEHKQFEPQQEQKSDNTDQSSEEQSTEVYKQQVATLFGDIPKEQLQLLFTIIDQYPDAKDPQKLIEYVSALTDNITSS